MPEFKIHNLWPTPVYENNFSVDEDGIKYIKNVTYERMSTDLSNRQICLYNKFGLYTNLYYRFKVKKSYKN